MTSRNATISLRSHYVTIAFPGRSYGPPDLGARRAPLRAASERLIVCALAVLLWFGVLRLGQSRSARSMRVGSLAWSAVSRDYEEAPSDTVVVNCGSAEVARDTVATNRQFTEASGDTHVNNRGYAEASSDMLAVNRESAEAPSHTLVVHRGHPEAISDGPPHPGNR